MPHNEEINDIKNQLWQLTTLIQTKFDFLEKKIDKYENTRDLVLKQEQKQETIDKITSDLQKDFKDLREKFNNLNIKIAWLTWIFTVLWALIQKWLK